MVAIHIARVSYIYATGIPYTAIGDMETYQKDTRCRGKWGQQSAAGSKALVVEHSLRAKAVAIRSWKGEGSLRPPGCPPGGLRAFIGSLAPSAQRAINKEAGSETAGADSQPYAPSPGGEYHSEDRLPRGSGITSAPRHNIMYRIA